MTSFTKDTGETLRAAGALSTVGLAFVLALVIGFWFGTVLDRWLGTKPVLTIVFFFFGLAAGILNVYRIVSQAYPTSVAAGRHRRPRRRLRPATATPDDDAMMWRTMADVGDADPSLRRVQRDSAIIAAAAVVLALALQGGRPEGALGVLAGAGLMGVSYAAIKGGVTALVQRDSGGWPRRAGGTRVQEAGWPGSCSSSSADTS